MGYELDSEEEIELKSIDKKDKEDDKPEK